MNAMKTPKNITGWICGLTVLLFAVSCEEYDYPDRFRATEGVPTVDYVRYADQDVFITQAFMDEVVCLVGSNLCSVHSILFNDQAAILNTSYITDNTLLVAVPSTQAVNKTDKIYLCTAAQDTVTVDFKVLPPSPKISEMSCEYAAVGQKVSITGKYFMDVKKLEMTGAAVSDFTVESPEKISFNIPSGAAAGPLYIETESGSAYSKFWYMDNRGILFTFEDGTRAPNGWNPADIISNPSDGISGNYLQFGNGTTVLDAEGGAWSEGSGGFSMPYWPGSWNDPENYADAPRLTDIVDFTNYATMAYKFEMNIPAEYPWKSNAMQVIPAPVTAVTGGNACTDIYGVQVAGANNTYFHESLSLPRAMYAPYAASGSYDTGGEWITVTLPISNFTYDWDGNPATGTLNADSFASLLIFFHGVAGAECTPIVKIDNIRVVPN